MITRREWLRRASVATAGALGGGLWGQLAPGESSREPKKQPNFVFIMTDDQKWDAIGYRDTYPFLRTPNMDRLAQEGAVFDHAFVTTSLCSPSRACFLTGVYAHKHGVRINEQNDPDPSLPTLQHSLQDAGYETAFIGKWHMKHTGEPRPGFDYWLGFKGQGEYFDPPLNENGRQFVAKGYMTDILTVHAEKWLREKRDKPFCMFLWHKAVHQPFSPAPRHADQYADTTLSEPLNYQDDLSDKPEWMRRGVTYGVHRDPWYASQGKPVPPDRTVPPWDGKNATRMNYLRALSAVDESLGRIYQTLEQIGELDNTVLVFTSDNGYMLGEHHCPSDKRIMWEESIKIPMVVRYPKCVAPGRSIDEMVLNIDLAPTFLDMAGATPPPSMQGRSFAPLLKGQATSWRDSIFYEYFKEEYAPGIPSVVGVRTATHKYIQYPELPDERGELYDLKKDPHEMVNQIDNPTYASVKKRLQDELERLKQEYNYSL